MEHKSSNNDNRRNVAQAIFAEQQEIQQPSNLVQVGLVRSLGKLKDDVAQLHYCTATEDPYLQGQSSSSAQLSTASLTDSFGEVCAVYEIKIIIYKKLR